MKPLFYTDKKGTLILRDEAIQLCPEFSFLSREELMFVILSTDYYALYHQFPQMERFQKAKNHVYKSDNIIPWEIARIKTAIDVYNSMQYDPRQEQLKVYERKLIVVNNEMEITNNGIQIKNYMATIGLLRNSIAAIQKEIYDSLEEDVRKEGGGRRSLIEDLMENMDRYKEITRKRQENAAKAELSSD